MSSERSRRIALLEQRKSKDLGFHDPDPDARGTGIYGGIGDVLRQARERRGLSLEEVATHLRISETYLAAIERGRFAQLPGRSYVLGFLRSYGKFLDLNADKVVAQYKAEDDDNFARKQQLKFPTVRPEGRTPGLWLLPVVMIVAAIGYLGWYGWKTELVSFDKIVPEVPARLQADTAEPPQAAAEAAGNGGQQVAGLLDRRDSGDSPAGGLRLARPDQAPPTAGAADAAQPAGEDAAPPAEEPAATGDLPETETSAAEAASVPGAPDRAAGSDGNGAAGNATAEAPDADAPPPLPSDPPPESAPPPSEGANGATVAALPPGEREPSAAAAGRSFGNNDGRVVLRASADTWVQVEDAQRNLLLTRVLKAGDIYRAPNQGGLVLMTGNAGGLVVEVDGKPIPSLGPRGAVRRNVSLDPERLLDGSQLVN